MLKQSSAGPTRFSPTSSSLSNVFTGVSNIFGIRNFQLTTSMNGPPCTKRGSESTQGRCNQPLSNRTNFSRLRTRKAQNPLWNIRGIHKHWETPRPRPSAWETLHDKSVRKNSAILKFCLILIKHSVTCTLSLALVWTDARSPGVRRR
jgi:hypothetical protein